MPAQQKASGKDPVPRDRILILLDSDPQPSVFDRVVAVDAGVNHLFAYGGVTVDQVQALVHGAIFTRGAKALRNTAIFIGGSDVSAGEAMLQRVTASFLGPLRVSVMLDANGANTTAVAAVLAARRHLDLEGLKAVVLAGTGPVGQRVARLLAREGAVVALASRSRQRADSSADAINAGLDDRRVNACEVADQKQMQSALEDTELVIAAGAAGVQLLPHPVWTGSPSLKVVIDLNAVPPLGIGGVAVTDKAAQRDDTIAYGAIGVGGTKMKIHTAAVAGLFEANDRVLDAEELYELGKQM